MHKRVYIMIENALTIIDVEYSKIVEYTTEESISEYIKPDEAALIYNHLKNDRDKLILSILWQTGARISEVLALRKIDINIDGIMMLTEKKRNETKKRNIKGDWVLLKIPKIKKKIMRRVIPIKPNLYSKIMEYYSDNKNNLLPDSLLFSITRGRVNQIFNKASLDAGITYKKIHPHLFRHGFAINFLKCGGLLPNLMKLLGHNHIQTTMIYLKFSGSDVRCDIDKMIF